MQILATKETSQMRGLECRFRYRCLNILVSPKTEVKHTMATIRICEIKYISQLQISLETVPACTSSNTHMVEIF